MGHQFGSRLRQLRLELGLLQRDVEEALSLGAGAQSQYERGLREPGFDLLLTFADYFDVAVDYLLGREYADRESPFLLEGRRRLQEHPPVILAESLSGRLAELVTAAGEAAPEVFALPKLARHLAVHPDLLRRMISAQVATPADLLRRLTEHLGLSQTGSSCEGDRAIMRPNSPRMRWSGGILSR